MSHIVSVRTQIRDPVAVAAACRRLGLAEPETGTVRLYSAQAEGLIVRLPGWRYPIVCNAATGEIQYDNYGGHWGQQQKLDQFLQAYACEKAKLEARKRGHAVNEQQLVDGSIRLQIVPTT